MIQEDRFISLNPSDYGKSLLRDINDVLGIDTHYINEYEVLDYLGYRIESVNFSNIIKSPHYRKKLGEIHRDTCAMLFFKDSTILLSEKLNDTRKRMTLFHEIGHDLIPWHRECSGYVTRMNDVRLALNKIIERQAFSAGSEIMFPLKYFLRDSQNIPISFTSIKYLANRYRASFEATCIRYASTHSNSMAIVVVVPEKDIRRVKPKKDSEKNTLFPYLQFNKPIIIKSRYPLQIQYGISSYKFPSHVCQGVEIDKDNIIFKCWSTKKPLRGKLSASMIGSHKTIDYDAECLYYYGKIFILLHCPDNQLELFKRGDL